MAEVTTIEDRTTQLPQNLKSNGRIATLEAASPETEIIVLNDHDLRSVMASLQRISVETVSQDTTLLGAATDFFCSIRSFLEEAQGMPESRMGLRSPANAKIDISPCLLAARALQNVATDYALTYPTRSQADVSKRQLAATFADVTESFLLLSRVEAGEQLITKDKADGFTEMFVEAKVAMRQLITQFSIMSLQIGGGE